MSGGWPRFAFVVAPVPFTLVSETADWIASSFLLLALGAVVAGWIVRHILGELALDRECDQPLEVESTEVNW
jgi:hypothetical protein